MIKYLQPTTVEEKMKLMEFVYKNTDSFILNTFGYLWESRLWWCMQPIQVYMQGKEIIGLHAFSINTKAPGTLKTYYIVTNKKNRGKGLAKIMILQALRKYAHLVEKYYVNSEEHSEGVKFYKKLLGNPTIETNEFGTKDFIFQKLIKDILYEQEV